MAALSYSPCPAQGRRDTLIRPKKCALDLLHCSYCIVAHGAILRIRARDPQLADYVASNPWAAALNPRQRTIVDLALVIATRPAELSEQDFQQARAAGLSDDEIWDVGAITALFAMSNRLAHLMALRPNDEFFTMGRAPRS
jgi:uncharacterized peroxidase-related enzyme